MANLPPGIRQEWAEEYIRRTGRLDVRIMWRGRFYPRRGRRAPRVAAYWQRLYEQNTREAGAGR